ncbi:MAG: hypothetical protein Q8K63_08630 [Acidimicrobiales bacterium]|nr:hypothetical protein [Acidimicrobiales bacterium]
MSELWTPGGENVPQPAETVGDELTEDEVAERLEALREQIARTPVDQIISQSAYQFFEIAALHLSIVPPQLDQARLAIDAFGLLVEGLGDRLGPDAAALREGLQQLRVTYVTVAQQGQPAPPD